MKEFLTILIALASLATWLVFLLHICALTSAELKEIVIATIVAIIIAHAIIYLSHK